MKISSAGRSKLGLREEINNPVSNSGLRSSSAGRSKLGLNKDGPIQTIQFYPMFNKAEIPAAKRLEHEQFKPEVPERKIESLRTLCTEILEITSRKVKPLQKSAVRLSESYSVEKWIHQN